MRRDALLGELKLLPGVTLDLPEGNCGEWEGWEDLVWCNLVLPIA